MVKYSEEHEWVKLEGDVVTVGITDFAQNELGDIVFVELPELGTVVSAGGDMATVESFKAASSVFAPLSGEVVEINDTLEADPAQVNTDPMGDGWFVKIKIEDPAALDKLLDECLQKADAVVFRPAWSKKDTASLNQQNVNSKISLKGGNYD